MKKLLATACLAASLPMTGQADLLFTVGGSANYWNVDPSGQVTDELSIEKGGLNLDSTGANQLQVFVEHPVPVLPNVQISNTGLKLDGTGKTNFTFLDRNFTGNTDTVLDVSHTDYTLYWGLPLPIPFVDINFGLTGRQFSGEVSVEGSATVAGNTQVTEEKEDLNFIVPMGYLDVDIDTPFGVYGYANINYIGMGDNSLSDTAFAIGYQLPIPVVDLGIEVGQRSMNLKTDDDLTDNLATDIELSGLFYGLSLSVGL